MTCVSCGVPALGVTLDGLAYCHRCFDWKAERLRRHLLRQQMLHNLACNLTAKRWEIVEVTA